MTPRKEQARTPRERELLVLQAQHHRSAARTADALVTLLSRADAETLAALVVVLRFVMRWARRGPR